MRGKWGIEVIIGALLLLCLIQSVAATATVVVAAADASQASKAAAQVFCDGIDDQTEINNAFNMLPAEGGVVQLTEGTFHSSGWIYPTANSQFLGAGEDKTTIDVYNAIDAYQPIHIYQDNVLVKGFTLRGEGFFLIRTNHVTIQDITATSIGANGVRYPSGGNGMFFIWVDNDHTGDIVFQNCKAIDCNTHGFNMNANRSTMQSGTRVGTGSYAISNLKFIDCQAVRCGFGVADGSSSEFATGFDIQEDNDLQNVELTNCLAEDNWENGFHFEPGYLKTKNVVLNNCISRNNGQRNPAQAPYHDVFVSGYYIHRNAVLNNCISVNNKNAGFFVHDGLNTVFNNCVDQGSSYGFKIVKGCADITLNDCQARNNKDWALWTAFTKNLQVKNFFQANAGGKSGYQDNLGYYYGEPQYELPVEGSSFDITAYGSSLPILNQDGSGNTYSLKTASADRQPTMPADIIPATVPPVYLTGSTVTLPGATTVTAVVVATPVATVAPVVTQASATTDPWSAFGKGGGFSTGGFSNFGGASAFQSGGFNRLQVTAPASSFQAATIGSSWGGFGGRTYVF
jgi:hypothetical protein